MCVSRKCSFFSRACGSVTDEEVKRGRAQTYLHHYKRAGIAELRLILSPVRIWSLSTEAC
jgi:hypothetical protein